MSWNGVGGGVMLFDVVFCIVERYFVLWSGIVYCDGRVVLWCWCLGHMVELSYS